MFVKICGTTSLHDAELAIACGADAVGFVFAPSRRQVSVEQVAAITAGMPEGIQRVGIFAAPDTDAILHAVRQARLTAIQLHLPHHPELLKGLSASLPKDVRIWQVVSFETRSDDARLAEQSFLRELLAALTDTRISAVLLDAAKAGRSGGSGESFPWQRVAPLVRQAERTAKQTCGETGFEPRPLIVAGGLNAENVAEAIHVFTPWGVDCVSGVEAQPGRKDRLRVEAFIKAARSER